MEVKKKLATAGAVATIGLTSLAGISTIAAQSGVVGTSDVVEKIATTFGLKEDAVQAVFDEVQEERQAERQTEISQHLQEAVDDGDITDEQKTLIEEKISELQVTHEAEKEELAAWAEENGIELKYLHARGPFGDDRLDTAVEDGDITEAQKTLIEQKQEELKKQREAARKELEDWADENDIELRYLFVFGHGFVGRGGHSLRGPF